MCEGNDGYLGGLERDREVNNSNRLFFGPVSLFLALSTAKGFFAPFWVERWIWLFRRKSALFCSSVLTRTGNPQIVTKHAQSPAR